MSYVKIVYRRFPFYLLLQLNGIIEHKESKGQRLQRLHKKTTLRKKFYLMPII